MNIIRTKPIWVDWKKSDGDVQTDLFYSIPAAQRAIRNKMIPGRVSATYILQNGKRIYVKLPFSTF